MTGALNFRAKIEIPPGEADVIHKLVLGGHFGMGAVKFTNLNVQEKVNTLSDRSRGEAGEPGVAPVVSNLKGRFVLKNAVAMFSGLTFRVPGADVQLSGSYGLENEALDFRGTLRMQAKLSETTTGVKSFLLKALDPFFKKKKAGAVIPIKITGTREQPSFGLNFGGKR